MTSETCWMCDAVGNDFLPVMVEILKAPPFEVRVCSSCLEKFPRSSTPEVQTYTLTSPRPRSPAEAD